MCLSLQQQLKKIFFDTILSLNFPIRRYDEMVKTLTVQNHKAIVVVVDCSDVLRNAGPVLHTPAQHSDGTAQLGGRTC